MYLSIHFQTKNSEIYVFFDKTMNTKIFLFVYFLLIVNAKAKNKIGLQECILNEVTTDLKQEEFKKKFESSIGFGLWNIIKNEYGHFTPSMTMEKLWQMCYCVSQKLYSYQGKNSSIGYDNHFNYYKKIPYFGWQNFFYFSSATIKCQIPNQSTFFIVETEKYYKAPKTRDLFVLEISTADFAKKDVVKEKGLRVYIKYPAGQFKAYIPSVDLTEVANT